MGYALVGGVLSFLGWVLDVPRLTDWEGDGITIKPNTALCLIAAALALILARVRPSLLAIRRLLGIFTAGIGGLTLLQHLTGTNLGIDTLLFDERPGAPATVAPGRMGPPASICFLVLGAALLLCGGGARARRWGASLALIPVTIASLALVGYLFGAGQLYAIPRLTGIAMQTASMIFALGIGIALFVPERGLALVLQRPDAGGLVLRRLLLPVILLPIVFGWLRLRGQGAGLYDTAFGTALHTIAEIALLVAILWWSARSLSFTDAALRRERERGTRLLTSMTDGFQVIDADGRFVELNSAAQRMCSEQGVDPDSLIGKHFFREAFPPMRDIAAGEAIQRSLKKQLPSYAESFYPPWNRWLSVRNHPTDEGGVATFIADITERKRAEEALRESERKLAAANEHLSSRAKHLDGLVEERTARLQEAIAELEAFSYSMAHDLRGPLRSMQSFADILMQDYGAQLDEEARGYLARIDVAAARMHLLISDVLSYTRIANGDLPLGPVDVTSLTREVIEQYPTLRGPHVRVAENLPAVIANRSALTQVLSNLLTNAVKFAPPTRVIAVEVTAEQMGEWVKLSVRDNGIGIAAEDQARIFKMFERVHSSEKYEGTGIGLAIVRRAIERMGGKMGVESEPDEGSRFWVELRLAKTP